MRRLLPIIIAALSIITFCCFGTSAHARNETIPAARRKKPPHWNQYCHKVVYDAWKVKHRCIWKTAEEVPLSSEAYHYTIKVTDQNSVTAKSTTPLYADGAETPYRSFVFNVAGVGFPSAHQEIMDATYTNTNPLTGETHIIENIYNYTTVIQVWNEAKGDWEFIDKGYGESLESSSTSLIEILDLDFSLEGHVEKMEEVSFRVGVVYYTKAHKPKVGKGYKGKPVPHYTFGPELTIEPCFDSDIFPDDDYMLDGEETCRASAIPIPATAAIGIYEEPVVEETNEIDMTDTDGDGYRDEWEIQRGSDPNDPNSTPNDWDGDDASNTLETACGSDPSDADSLPLDNDMDCDEICDAIDPNDHDGPCGDGDTDDDTDVDLSDDYEDYDDDLIDLPAGEDEYDISGPDTLNSEADGTGGGCSLNPQATATGIMPLFMALIAAMSLVVIRKRQ